MKTSFVSVADIIVYIIVRDDIFVKKN